MREVWARELQAEWCDECVGWFYPGFGECEHVAAAVAVHRGRP